MKKQRSGASRNDTKTQEQGGRFTAEHESQLAGDQLMEDLRAFGRVPKEVKGSDPAKATERRFARRLRFARAGLRLSVVHEAELFAFHAQELRT